MIIALVITIIMLLILSGITIVALTGEEGKIKTKQSSKVELIYEEQEIDKTSAKLLITIISIEGISEIEMPDKDVIKCNGIKEKVGIDYIVKYDTEYKIIITTANGEKVEKIIYVERKVEIKLIKQPIVNTDPNADKSLDENTINRGTTLYVNFSVELEGMPCIIKYNGNEIQLPYIVATNDKYIFTAEGEYNGRIITKDIEVDVVQFKAAINLVKYDAGEWTKEEIEELESLSLYDLNASHEVNYIFKLNNSSGLNFTFGGFKLGDSRNNSVSSKDGIAMYDGWQILEIKDSSGNIIRNETQISNTLDNIKDEKIYVTKLIHAGTPENFVLRYTWGGDIHRAEYLLSNGKSTSSYLMNTEGQIKDEYKTLSNDEGNTIINTRNWDIYKDKTLDKKGYIKQVHLMTYQEALDTTEEYRRIGIRYWLENLCTKVTGSLWAITADGNIDFYSGSAYCFGIRPIVELNEGVYMIKGKGKTSDPYILGKE